LFIPNIIWLYEDKKSFTKASELTNNEDFEGAIELLDGSLKLYPTALQKDKILKQKENTLTLQTDLKNYNEGMGSYDTQSYETAMDRFKLISEDSPKYSDAQAKIADCSSKIVESTAASTSTPAARTTPSPSTSSQNSNQAKRDFAQSKVDLYVGLMKILEEIMASSLADLDSCIAEGIVDDCQSIYQSNFDSNYAQAQDYAKQADDWQKQVLLYSN